MPPLRRRAPRRPCTEGSTRGWSFSPRVVFTSASARSTVPPIHWPRSTSTQARTAPRPCATAMPRSAWWRRRETSTRANCAYNCPLQSCQRPLWVVSSGWRNRPIRVKRSPHSGGGVASMRRLWRQLPLRTTMSTSCSAKGGAARSSSVQRSVPPRMTSSGCAKNQSAAAPSPGPWSGSSSPASRMRPSRVRRMSSSGLSMYSCSKPKFHSDRGETASTTRGKRSASRPWVSSKATSPSSTVGIKPSVRAVTVPSRTGTPRARVACSCSCAR